MEPTVGSKLDHLDEAFVLLNICSTLKRIEALNLVLHPSALVPNSPVPDEFERAFTILAIQTGVTCLFTDPAMMNCTGVTTDELLGKASRFD